MIRNPDVLTTGEVADLIGLSVATVRRAVWTGDLAAWASPGGHLRYNRSDVLAYRDDLKIVPPLIRSMHHG